VVIICVAFVVWLSRRVY